ncbi:social motility TPR repeat lipoprotein Tgl [Vitiosangium sp. GDMCC 1.1324]|uniref:social motility TPR repeat lipoprotein Tgl n=1 Tax=Vitiosangium sp. (strain GDMCC 1.1324) TaxID=2138576 RepID=UPI000D388167|nr:social motility TPR repeat lipoprotein Tgl [Vitiosangium sp. GDMCC 1.1324]PTL76327.1 social gliding motility protein Tgl [Vitiosangium sp. GDMCC 1.1324]
MLRLHPAWLLALALMGCKHVPTEQERQGAEIHYELGLQAQQMGSVQEAYKEMQKSLELDPDYPEAHNAIGILLHMAFNRPEEAIQHYRKALEVRPGFSEAKTNLANVYLSQSRYDEAIKLYEAALNDMLYTTPFIAQGNMGWALYKKGELERGLQSIKASVTTNPGFCLGYKNLGIIYDETGNVSEACRYFGRYREACPDVADAYLREGACQVKQGKMEEARQSFTACEAKAKSQGLQDDCRRLLEAL